MGRLKFELQARASDSRARAATFTTLHGRIESPLFMPVGTQATVKGQTLDTITGSGSQILLANTYHLLLRPGPEVFQKMGGIQRFMSWKGSVLTDSGGFQIFSLPNSRKMSEEGATFTSHLDGRTIHLSPELSIDTQKAIGSDIMMVLDQCVPSTSERAVAEEAMLLTHRWAKRSLVARGDSPQALFGIVQGACFPDLRRKSAEALAEMSFDGFAIGGLAVGEPRSIREDITEATTAHMPENLPRYLMGVGTPIDILEAVHRGVDMFDCILPTAFAQQGVAFTSAGKLELRRAVYRVSEDRLDASCACPTCAGYSRAYLHHLVKAKEVLGWHLIGAHNLYFYHSLMREIRAAILEGRFAAYYREKRPLLEQGDLENPKQEAGKEVSRGGRGRGGPPLEIGSYAVHFAEEGFATIAHTPSGERMHSVSRPEDEAFRLYVEQSRLKEKVLAGGDSELVIWDVGLGAAANAMTAIREFEQAAGSGVSLRPMRIVSFENDLDSLRLAIGHPVHFPYLKHAGPRALLEEGSWKSKNLPLRWDLIEGDFFDKLLFAPAPDLIFFDPFSPKTDSPVWSLRSFERIFSVCRGKSTELFTYSASTAARAALLGAGFFVGKGVATGPKKETTRAFAPGPEGRPGQEAVPFLLDYSWLVRWERSDAKFPEGLSAAEQDRLAARIRAHRQFL